MEVTREERLAAVLASVHARWGTGAILSAHDLIHRNTHEYLSTGIPSVDTLLGGGVTTRELLLLRSYQTTGATTLALHMLATTQKNGRYAAYIDLEGVFDAKYAAHCGIELDTLLLIHPETLTDGVEILCELLRHSALSVAVIDLMLGRTKTGNKRYISPSSLKTLSLTLRSAATAMIVLDGQVSVFEPIAFITCDLIHRRWLFTYEVLTGYEAELHLVKAHPPLLGQHATMQVTFHPQTGMVKGDLV